MIAFLTLLMLYVDLINQPIGASSMKQLLLSTIFCLMFSSFSAQADIFQSFRENNFDQALKEAQLLEDTETLDPDGWTALMYAARLGQVEIAKELLKKNANLEAKNHAGLTPYLWAAYAGHVDMMKFLHENGANIYHENAYHENALDIATISNEVDAVRYILANIPDEEKKQEMVQNAIYLTQSDEIKAILIEAGAIDTTHEEAEEEEEAQKAEESEQKTISEEELNAFIEQQHPEFFVMLALSKNENEKALSFIEKQQTLNPEFRTQNGWNLLVLATMKNNPQLIQALIKKGFDVNDNKVEFKATPLILAISHGKKQAALELLKTPNILIDYKDQVGRNALDMIQKEKDPDLMQALQKILAQKEDFSKQKATDLANEGEERTALIKSKENSSVSEHINQETEGNTQNKPTPLAAQEDSTTAIEEEPSNETEELSIVEQRRKAAYSYH